MEARWPAGSPTAIATSALGGLFLSVLEHGRGAFPADGLAVSELQDGESIWLGLCWLQGSCQEVLVAFTRDRNANNIISKLYFSQHFHEPVLCHLNMEW